MVSAATNPAWREGAVSATNRRWSRVSYWVMAVLRFQAQRAKMYSGTACWRPGPERGGVICQVAPWRFDDPKNDGLKRTFRRTSFLAVRLLANAGVAAETPLLARWAEPVRSDAPGRWLEGLFLDLPEEWDDPYRFFRG